MNITRVCLVARKTDGDIPLQLSVRSYRIYVGVMTSLRPNQRNTSQ